MPVNKQQRPAQQPQERQAPQQQQRQQRRCKPCAFGGFRKMFQNKCRAAMQASNAQQKPVDQKLRNASFRVRKLSCKLVCCFSCFAFLGVLFFIHSMLTLSYAGYNAAHIAQTGHLPWVNRDPWFMPDEEPAPYQEEVYSIFINKGFILLGLSATMWMFAMRTFIAAALNRGKNSMIAFRRTLYCIFAFVMLYGFLFNETAKLQDVYPTIADDLNVTMQFQHEPMDFGGRYLQEQQFDLPEFLQNLRNNFENEIKEQQKKEQQELLKEMTENKLPFKEPETEMPSAEPKRQHHHKRRHHGKHGKHGKHHRRSYGEDGDQRPPCMRRYEDEIRRHDESMYERVGGTCPVCFIFILICAIAQLCVLKRHARACKNLKDLKDAQAAERIADQADLEAQQEYQAVINSSIVESEDKAGDFDYSIEEPANPEDKEGSDLVFQINHKSGSITVNQNKMV